MSTEDVISEVMGTRPKFRVRDMIRRSHKRKFGNAGEGPTLNPAERQQKANAIRANRRRRPEWFGCDCWE